MHYFAGITLSLFLFLMLVLKKGKSSADKILMVWMAVLTVHQTLFYLDYSGVALRFPHLLGLLMPLPVLHGVLLFFYVSVMTGRAVPNVKSALPHFAPFLLLVLLATPFYALSGPEKKHVFEHAGEGYEWYKILQLSLVLASGLGYVAASLVLIRSHRRRVQDFFSDPEKRSLRWLEYLSIGLGIIWLLIFFPDDGAVFSGVVVFVLFIGLFGIQQAPVFYDKTQLENGATTPDFSNAKTEHLPERYAKSGLKTEGADDLHARLTDLMQRETPFKNGELTLADLAKMLEVHPNYLSQAINEKEHKNFFNYINTLRTAEFIRLAALPENRKFTLIALAYDCGFNSKSTFNKYFKSHTGQTPSEYFNDSTN